MQIKRVLMDAHAFILVVAQELAIEISVFELNPMKYATNEIDQVFKTFYFSFFISLSLPRYRSVCSESAVWRYAHTRIIHNTYILYTANG